MDRHPDRIERREKIEPRAGLAAGRIERVDLRLERIDSADCVDRQNRQQNHHSHLQDELKQVGHQARPTDRKWLCSTP